MLLGDRQTDRKRELERENEEDMSERRERERGERKMLLGDRRSHKMQKMEIRKAKHF
jgi:hypothetical protein